MNREEAIEKLESTVGAYLLSGHADDTTCGEWREILEALKDELQGKQEESQQKIWKPKMGEWYWFVDEIGRVQPTTWDDNAWNACEERQWQVGNVFKTEAEAAFEVERLKVVAELKRYADEHNEHEIDWRHGRTYFIMYDHYLNLPVIDWRTGHQYSKVNFTSEEIAKDAIKQIGEDRIRLFYFGIGKEEWIKERE